MTDLIKRLAQLPGDRRAAFIAKLRSAATVPAARLEARQRPDSIPLSYAQETLWFLDQLAPGRSTYNVSTGYWLRGALDVTALTRALTSVVSRHESLRTSLPATGTGPGQRIEPHIEVALEVTEVAGADEAERITHARRLAQAQARRPFDLACPPLWRLRLFRLDEHHHLLVFVVHHVICDGWSLGVFARDLAAAYTTATTANSKASSKASSSVNAAEPGDTARPAPGQAQAPAPALPVQYADYTLWQRERLAGKRRDELIGFWRDRLAGAPVLEFPTDRPRPALVTYDGSHVRHLLGPALREGVHRLAATHGVTANAVLVSAFLAFLHRYTGQEDLVIGTPTANRGQVELEDMIGFFVNMIVIRGDLTGDPTTRELLKRTGAVLNDALAHGELPFDKLVEALHPTRDPSRSPLFQVAFTYQNAGSPLDLPGLTVTEESLDPGTSRFDMSWNATEVESGIEIYIEYNTDLFDAQTIHRHLRHFERLLGGMVAEPQTRVSGLALLSDAERQELITRWNGPSRRVPDTTIVELFSAQVRRDPHAIAVVVGDQRLTYGELHERSDRLAGLLRGYGAAPGELVALCLPRSIDTVVSVLAVLKSGAGYVPIDAAYPRGRMNAILSDAAPVALLTLGSLTGRLPGDAPPLLLLDEPPQGPPSSPPSDPPSDPLSDPPSDPPSGRAPAPGRAGAPTPTDIAYVIYTSGTTGTPKGVLIEHASVVNFIGSVQELFELSPADRVLGFAALNFDVSVFEMFSALLTGARLYLASDDERLSIDDLQRLMEDAEITVIDLPPTVMALLDPTRLPALRICFVGGEAFSGELVERWNPGRRFFNGYGPTECTVTMVVQECPGTWSSSPPIGLPMANHVAHVLDRHLQLVPYGVAGELVVGGAGLTRGYLHAPELTEQKIVPDPFGTAPGGRLYRTGDLVRRRPDGAIVFLGRIDQQVKIRGLRIELGEIEAVLAAHPAVAQAVVEVWTDAGGDRRLVAYTTTAPCAERPTAAELREHLAEQLPAWMLPAFYVPLDALPLSVSGKVDRRALPPPGNDDRAVGTMTAPATTTEHILAEEIFAPLLGVEQVGTDGNFFALGGHSLQATQLIARILQRFDVDIALSDFFRMPTVAGLAVVVDRARALALDEDSMLTLIEKMSDTEATRLLDTDARRPTS